MKRIDYAQVGRSNLDQFKDRLVSLVGFTPGTLPDCLVMFYGVVWAASLAPSWEVNAVVAQWAFNTHGVQAIDALRRLQGDEACADFFRGAWVATEPEILNPPRRIY